MQAQHVMATNIATVRPDTALADAIKILLDRHISGLPVVDAAGKLIGILTEGDLLRRAETGTERHHARWFDFLAGPGRLAAEYVRTHGRRVEDLMTDTVVAVSPETSLADVVALMEDKRIKRVPVVRDGALVGIVSRADLLRPLAEALIVETKPISATDRQIQDAITAEFVRQKWAPLNGIKIDAVDGVVVLNGLIFDHRDRAAMMVVARNVPGVKEVRDELTWVEPVTGSVLGPTI